MTKNKNRWQLERSLKRKQELEQVWRSAREYGHNEIIEAFNEVHAPSIEKLMLAHGDFRERIGAIKLAALQSEQSKTAVQNLIEISPLLAADGTRIYHAISEIKHSAELKEGGQNAIKHIVSGIQDAINQAALDNGQSLRDFLLELDEMEWLRGLTVSVSKLGRPAGMSPELRYLAQQVIAYRDTYPNLWEAGIQVFLDLRNKDKQGRLTNIQKDAFNVCGGYCKPGVRDIYVPDKRAFGKYLSKLIERYEKEVSS